MFSLSLYLALEPTHTHVFGPDSRRSAPPARPTTPSTGVMGVFPRYGEDDVAYPARLAVGTVQQIGRK